DLVRRGDLLGLGVVQGRLVVLQLRAEQPRESRRWEVRDRERRIQAFAQEDLQVLGIRRDAEYALKCFQLAGYRRVLVAGDSLKGCRLVHGEVIIDLRRAEVEVGRVGEEASDLAADRVDKIGTAGCREGGMVVERREHLDLLAQGLQ